MPPLPALRCYLGELTEPFCPQVCELKFPTDEDAPMVVEFEIEGLGKMDYYLAPKLEQD